MAFKTCRSMSLSVLYCDTDCADADAGAGADPVLYLFCGFPEELKALLCCRGRVNCVRANGKGMVLYILPKVVASGRLVCKSALFLPHKVNDVCSMTLAVDRPSEVLKHFFQHDL